MPPLQHSLKLFAPLYEKRDSRVCSQMYRLSLVEFKETRDKFIQRRIQSDENV